MLQFPSDFCRRQLDHHFWETRCGNSCRNLDVRNSCLLGWRIRAAKETAWPSHLASKKKVLAECCSVHQIFAGNSLTITSEKHGVEIPAETGCKKFLPPWVACCIRAARYRLTITPGIKKTSVGGMLQCPSDFCRQQLDHHFWETRCGNSRRNLDVRNSCLLGWRIRAAKKTAWPSHLASKKKCWRNAAVSIRFLQATAWPSLLRNTVWKFLQKLGCKKFLPPWVECCIRAARYRLTITPGIKKKVLAECCSVHQIFAGNRLTITSEKHSVEIAAETWM